MYNTFGGLIMRYYNKETHYKVLLITSYCDGIDNKCTDDQPCTECLSMCNTFSVQKEHLGKYLGQVDFTGEKYV